jgi:hypothetical protein
LVSSTRSVSGSSKGLRDTDPCGGTKFDIGNAPYGAGRRPGASECNT